MSPVASSSSNVPGQSQSQNQAPSSHVAAAIVGQKQSFLQQGNFCDSFSGFENILAKFIIVKS